MSTSWPIFLLLLFLVNKKHYVTKQICIHVSLPVQLGILKGKIYTVTFQKPLQTNKLILDMNI